MKNLLLLVFVLFLFSCQGFEEKNQLAIPPIANEELKVTK